jgi:adenine deaminase
MYFHPMSHEERIALMNTAQGRTPADVILSGGQLVNVYSAEILPHLWVAIKGERIAYVGPPDRSMAGKETEIHELNSRFIVPGFIDGHTHLDSIFQVGAYADYALAFGNTAAVSEVAMTANAMGVRGVEYFIREIETLPMRVFVLAPPGVPPFPAVETSRPFPVDYFKRLLTMDRCLGVGESYWPTVTDYGERALAQYRWSERAGKTREGHAAGARGKNLQAYKAAGTTSCHESVTAEEALEKLRLGMAVMIREGYVRRELDAVSGIARKGVDLTNAMIVTDIADPQELVEQGGMNLLLKKAVSLGFDPVKAIQMVTVNAARYFGLNDLGGIAPGNMADLVVVEDLKSFHCHKVWAGGRLVAQEEKPIKTLERIAYPEESRRSIAIEGVGPEVFTIPCTQAKARVRVVELVNETITQETPIEMESHHGRLIADPGRDIVKAAVFNKSDAGAAPGLGFTKGVGLRSGALAMSILWDTNNILVIGTSDQEMAAAMNELIRMHGGMVVVQGEKVVAQAPLPICGIISPQPLPQIVREIKEVEAACQRLGSSLARPFLSLQTFSFTGLPFLRLTDQGLVDVRKMRKVTLFL